MKKYDWTETRKFWEIRDSHWAETDHGGDPDALQNVLCSDEPLWLNRRWARYQEMAYQSLFDLLPTPAPGAKALDVGCGAGRWSRFLSGRGYRATGIDLQPKLIEANRSRFPNMEFVCGPVQEYSPEEPFDLVSSVVVIHMNPYEEQLAVIGKIRELLKSGGHVIMLEGIWESEEPYNFPRTTEGWIEAFEGSGFRAVATQYYNYNLLWRSGSRLASMLRRRRSGGGGSKRRETTLEEVATASEDSGGLSGGSPRKSATRLAIELDAFVEPVVARANKPLTASHCGFLFRAV